MTSSPPSPTAPAAPLLLRSPLGAVRPRGRAAAPGPAWKDEDPVAQLRRARQWHQDTAELPVVPPAPPAPPSGGDDGWRGGGGGPGDGGAGPERHRRRRRPSAVLVAGLVVLGVVGVGSAAAAAGGPSVTEVASRVAGLVDGAGDASTAQDPATTSDRSAGATAPEATSPDTAAPDATAPDTDAPDTDAPDAAAPDAAVPGEAPGSGERETTDPGPGAPRVRAVRHRPGPAPRPVTRREAPVPAGPPVVCLERGVLQDADEQGPGRGPRR